MAKLMYELVLFDLDKTLADFNSDTLYPHAQEWFDHHPEVVWAVVTNQGGVGMRFWMEDGGFGDPSKYPTEQDIDLRLAKLFAFCKPNLILKSFCYQSAKGNWSPVPKECIKLDEWRQDWRKPAPGMLKRAMQILNKEPDQTLMVGDGEEDFIAASKAGVQFMYPNDFFEVYK